MDWAKYPSSLLGDSGIFGSLAHLCVTVGSPVKELLTMASELLIAWQGRSLSRVSSGRIGKARRELCTHMVSNNVREPLYADE